MDDDDVKSRSFLFSSGLLPFFLFKNRKTNFQFHRNLCVWVKRAIQDIFHIFAFICIINKIRSLNEKIRSSECVIVDFFIRTFLFQRTKRKILRPRRIFSKYYDDLGNIRGSFDDITQCRRRSYTTKKYCFVSRSKRSYVHTVNVYV